MPDLVGDKIPADVILAAVQSAADEGAEFIAVDGVVASVNVNEMDDVLDENPLLRGLRKKCKNGECRKKCNAKGKNGACVWIKCVCWK